MKKIFLALVFLIALFLGYVATQDGNFRYEHSGVIHAPPDKIFPYLSELKRGQEWLPYEKIDPNMKKVFSDSDGVIGATMEFDGNKDVGAGKLEITSLIPNELVEIKLTMTRPIKAENLVEYRLSPVADGTQFTWAMSGNAGFAGKLFSVFIDCEEMMKKDFSQGIANLTMLVEGQK